MSDDQVKILDGNTFVVSDGRGDVEASRTDPTGLFSFDTRFLSKWVLSVNGQRLAPLSIDDLQYFEARFFLVPGTGTVYVDAKVSVIRHRTVGNGFQEKLTILNHDDEPLDVVVRVEAGCDFADLFEVKDALEKKGSYSRHLADRSLRLAYERETFVRATTISSSHECVPDEGGLTFETRIDPHGTWSTELDVAIELLAASDDTAPEPSLAWQTRRPVANMARNLERWLEDGTETGVRLGAVEDDLSPQPDRPRRAALLTDQRRPRTACRRRDCPGS